MSTAARTQATLAPAQHALRRISLVLPGPAFLAGGILLALASTLPASAAGIILDVPEHYTMGTNAEWGFDDCGYSYVYELMDNQKLNCAPHKGIKSVGCTLCSVAMVLRYHGVDQLPDGQPVSAANLNRWLTTNFLYAGCRDISFGAISSLTYEASLFNDNVALDYDTSALYCGPRGTCHSMCKENEVVQSLWNGVPPIITVRTNGRHKVVLHGYNDLFFYNEYYYTEPAACFGNHERTLGEPYGPNSTYLEWCGIRVLVPATAGARSGSSGRSFSVDAEENTRILLSDPNGFREGEDADGTPYHEIPGGFSERGSGEDDHDTNGLDDGYSGSRVTAPTAGTWQVQLAGPEGFAYQAHLRSAGTNGTWVRRSVSGSFDSSGIASYPFVVDPAVTIASLSHDGIDRAGLVAKLVSYMVPSGTEALVVEPDLAAEVRTDFVGSGLSPVVGQELNVFGDVERFPSEVVLHVDSGGEVPNLVGGNHRPAAGNDNAETRMNQGLDVPAVDLLANDQDSDGDVVQFVAAAETPNTHGEVSWDGGTVHYEPDPDYTGAASFVYTITDGRGRYALATVLVTISPCAIEICNGIDDDCDGDIDDGAGPPSATSGLVFANKADLMWSPTIGANAYDIVKGGLLLLQNTAGDFANSLAGCLENDSTDSAAIDTEDPAQDGGSYYIVRAVGCGQPGTYDSGHVSQRGSRDAEIQASGSACP